MILSKTRLSVDFTSQLIHTEDYELVRNDSNFRQGGVCWYIRKHLCWKIINTSFANRIHTEQLWIHVSNVNIKIEVIYRPPNGPASSLQELELYNSYV